MKASDVRCIKCDRDVSDEVQEIADQLERLYGFEGNPDTATIDIILSQRDKLADELAMARKSYECLRCRTARREARKPWWKFWK